MFNVRNLFLVNSEQEKTFMFDNTLPSLPVPDLDETIEKYLNSLLPFVSPAQYERTKIIADEFKVGIGPTLQKKLLERSNEKKNWLAEWWLKYAYLSLRNPIAPLLNMAGVQSLNFTLWQPNEETALEQAALALWVTLDFYINLRKENIKPHISKKGKRMSMNQFRFLFNTARIPKEEVDEIDNYFKTESEGTCPQHLIVLCKGHIWFLDPWITEDECITAPELEDQIKYIKRISESLGQGQEVGALTFDDRERWAKNRRWLMSLCPENADNVKLIESAILSYSLEDESPSNVTEACQIGLCGNPSNRWADKSYSASTYRNGYHSNSNDHSPYDAMVSVLVGYYQHEVITKDIEGSWRGTKVIRQLVRPKRLHFKLDDLLTNAISRVKMYNLKLRESIKVKFMDFLPFGKNWIKEQKVHPDAFVQCSLQLAYYFLNEKLAPTYETATTRQFYRARTETIRSCTSEMKDFVLSMVSTSSTKMEKKEKLKAAITRHCDLMSECENGQGVDRHLMGLGIIAAESGLPTPDIFTDPSFTLSGGNGNFVLSTSTVGYTYVLGGVAAMVKDGYGIFYTILPDRLHFFLTNYTEGDTCLEKYSTALTKSLNLMREVMDECTAKL